MDNPRPILLVEDDRLDMMAVHRVLRELHVSNELMYAENGEEALTLLTDGRHETPCLILLDLNMPKMNGLEFLEAMRANDALKNIPVAIVTTSDARQDVARSLELGAVAYILKSPDYGKFRANMGVVESYVKEVRFRKGANAPARPTGEHVHPDAAPIANRQIPASATRTDVENDLRVCEEQFRLIFEHAPDAYFLRDLQDRILDVNKKAEQLIGYSREEQIGRTIIELGAVPPSEVSKVLSVMTGGVSGSLKGPHELTLRHKNGSLVFVEVTAFPIRIEGDPVVCGIARDVTERTRTEANLQQQKELLTTIVSRIPHFVFWKDRNSVYLGCNEVFAQSAGLKRPEDIVGKTDYDMPWHNEADSYRACDRQVMDSGEPLLDFEERQTGREDRQITLLTSKVPLHDASGRVIGVLGIYSDITERKQVERKQTQLLEQLTAVNQELQDFAYIVSHDLKAPLRAIRTLADWLAADYRDKLDEQGKENLRLLGSRVDRMQGLIDGVLQYSRVGHTEEDTTPVDLGRVVPEIVANLAAPEHISIRIEAELPTVEANPTRITQVFQNLLSNAIKYMDKPQGDICIGCREQDGFWKFSVSDNGPGIEQKHFERIFKLFQTLTLRDSSESTGVGLTITKKIVEMYGGEIWVESKVGQGSTFFFTLPKAPEEAAASSFQNSLAESSP